MTDVHAFWSLFQGRDDAWGAVHGECMKQPIDEALLRTHLESNGSVGFYPLVDGKVRWGCTDIDSGYDMIAQAVNIWKVLRALGISSWVEKTKGKGFHIWCFASDWVDAEVMRRMFLFAHQIADVPAKEVNPKQTSLEGLKGWGSHVNLPYARAWVLQGKRVVLDMERADRCPLSLDEFLARVKTNEPSAIAAVAARYVPPPPLKHVAIGEYDGDLEQLTRRMGGLTWTIFENGPLEGKDRSNTMMRLCHLMHEDGFTPDEAMACLYAFDEVWGKFVGRHDREQQLTKMVERAFG